MARLEAEQQAKAKKKRVTRFAIIGAALAIVVIGLTFITSRGKSDSSTAAGDAPKVTIPAGAPPKKIGVKDLRKGTGEIVKKGDTIQAYYTGVAWSTKKQFDSNWGADKTVFPVTDIGTNKVSAIKGWNELVGMRVGGRRQLVIPPDLAYGKNGQGAIGPNETLVFVVDVVGTGPTAPATSLPPTSAVSTSAVPTSAVPTSAAPTSAASTSKSPDSKAPDSKAPDSKAPDSKPADTTTAVAPTTK